MPHLSLPRTPTGYSLSKKAKLLETVSAAMYNGTSSAQYVYLWNSFTNSQTKKHPSSGVLGGQMPLI
jgi:hypothetical protein